MSTLKVTKFKAVMPYVVKGLTVVKHNAVKVFMKNKDESYGSNELKR